MIFFRRMRHNAAKLSGDRSATLDLARGRLVLISAFFALIYMILAVRVIDLSVMQAHVWQQDKEDAALAYSAADNQGKIARGSIYDANGQLLASSLQMASLYADAQLIATPKATAQGLIKIFPDLSYGKLLQDLQGKKRFIWVKRNITPAQQEAVMTLGEPGLAFRSEYRRVYPHKNELAHLVGITNVDGLGLSGLERSFDRLLSQGEDLHLSIDIRLQHALRRELERAIAEFEAIGGAGVIMDARSGEILGGVSLPDFNPHEVSLAAQDELFNRMSLGVYELGSVFKIFSTAAFLEAHKELPFSTTFDATDPIKAGRFRITDYHAQKRPLTIPEIFMHSSNIGTALMAQEIGGEALQNFYADLGLLSAPDIEIAETAQPLVPQRWGEIATMTASYGHGLATTPVNVTSAMASIVNGGYLVKPTFIKMHTNMQKGMQKSMQEGSQSAAPIKMQVLSEETSYKMRELLRLVTEEGTGGKAAVSGYKVGGKTGTAEKSGASGGYDRKRLISSFLAAFPMDNPRYAVFVAVDEPKGQKHSYGYATAGWVAAPATARVIASMASILGLEPHYDPPSYENPLKIYIAQES